MAEKNSLVAQGAAQKDPSLAKPSEFKVSKSEGGQYKSADGKDKLCDCCDSPRNCEDGGEAGGAGTPASGDRGKIVAKHFPIGKNKAGEGTSVSIPESVNLKTGLIEGKGRRK